MITILWIWYPCFNNENCTGTRTLFPLQIDYIIAKGLGVVMVWSLDQDDFSNSCGNGPYPLMNVLRSRLSGITMSTQSLASSTLQSSGVVDRQSTTVGVTGLSITNGHSSTGFQTNTPLSSKQPSSTPLTSNHQTSTPLTPNHLATSTVASSAGLSSCGGLWWNIDIECFIFFKFLLWSMLVLLDRLAPQSCVDGQLYGDSCDAVSYTHLTLPTICSV